MLSNNDLEPRTGFRNYLIVSSVLIVLVLLYVGWIFYSRARQDRAIEEKAAAQQREQDRKTFEGMGGNRFAILGFYANPGTIRRGDSVDLCYSVSNAKSVTLEPQSNAVWPAFSHCVQVTPRKTTAYTLTAKDAAGNTKTATVRVEVR
ncbi:MAG TPA: hypothetical protein VNE63_21225 [Candidatus Acidoferrales bacterium]|nr:hypothetical protein [Candidatus Acidoferrales bacterium]